MLDKVRLDSLINEYKGNFFEFLIGQEFSKKFDSELTFLSHLNPEIMEMLSQQEKFLRTYAPHLLHELPGLAEVAIQKFQKTFPLTNNIRVELLGKITQTLGIEDLGETDVIIHTEESSYYLSVKLAKWGSFVNCKSAGMRSLLTKYFVREDLQNKFNHICDFMFEELALKMNTEAGLGNMTDFSAWERAGFETLPGRLPGSLKQLLLEYYQGVNNELFKNLQLAHDDDPSHFVKHLLPLMGYSRPDLIKMICSYELINEKFKKTEIELARPISEKTSVTITKKTNNVEVHLGKHILQLRPKPMNKFTSKSFKINCSVKN